MSLEIVWTATGEREALRLDPPVRRRILASLERYAETGHGDVRRLSGTASKQFRLRVGDWRLRFIVDVEAQELYVLSVRSRGKAYR